MGRSHALLFLFLFSFGGEEGFLVAKRGDFDVPLSRVVEMDGVKGKEKRGAGKDEGIAL